MGTHFLWNPINDNIVKEFDDAGNTIADYTSEPNLYGDLISQHRDGQSSFYHYDGQGSTTSLTNSATIVTDTYAYTAFGEMTERTGTTVNPFQYIGRHGYYRDETFGGYLARRRHLSVDLMRWLAADTLWWVRNRYTYADNNPLSYIDPLGEDFIALAHYRIPRLPVFGALAVAFHYSLEYWICCDPPHYEMVGMQFELLRWQRDHYDALEKPELLETCFPVHWVELSGFDIVADAMGSSLPLLTRQRYRVPISVIRYDRNDHGPIEAIRILFEGDYDLTEIQWGLLVSEAKRYEWAEQEGFGPGGVFAHWPQSLYWAAGTNSRTFIYQMVQRMGFPWLEMSPGRLSHPGWDAPVLNPLNNPDDGVPYRAILDRMTLPINIDARKRS